MNVKRFLSLLMLVSFAIVKSADNNLVRFVDKAKAFAGIAAYGASFAVTKGLAIDNDVKTTINASAAFVAEELVNGRTEIDKDATRKQNDESKPPVMKNKETGKLVLDAIKQGVKPAVLYGSVKFGIPFINNLCSFFPGLQPLISDDKVSLVQVQKIALCYVGVLKGLGILK